MGLLHASLVQRKVRYFIHYSHKDIELDYKSNTSEIFAIPPWAPEVAIPSVCPYFNSSGSCILGGRPSVWNGLPLELRLIPRVHFDAL